MSKISTKKLITLGVLVAMDVVLTRFLSINAWNTRIGFGFVPMVVAAIMYGPVSGGVVAAVADVVGALMFPTGPFFPGFTFTALITGVTFGLFLHKKQSLWRIVAAVAVTQFVYSLFLNTYWICLVYGAHFKPLLATRVVQSAIISGAQIVVIPLLAGAVKRFGKTFTETKKTGAAMTEQEAVAYIEDYTWSVSKFGLERTRDLLKALGDPQKKLKFIHVTGSNGKGSTCAMLESVLRQAGYKTGLYTSPYIEEFRERMRVNGENIPGDTLGAITARVKELADQMEDHPSQFELVTAIAMEYFMEAGCDIVVLEVGMGGAMDATNVIDAPEAAIITNIGLEHTEVLGDTLEAIAAQKSGIIKPGCAAVCYDGAPEVTAVVRNVCAEKGVPLYAVDFGDLEPLSETLNGQTFRWKGAEYAIALLGRHQLYNAAVALTAVDALRERGWEISGEAVTSGLRLTRWPARLEVLQTEPLCILDGGHNPQCAQALTASLDELLPGEKVTFLMGVLADKDYPQIIDIILPYAARFVTLTPVSPRALSAEDLAAELRARGADAVACGDIAQGLRTAREAAGEDGALVIFGSLYLAGAVRTEFRKQQRVAKAAQRRTGRAARMGLTKEERAEKSAAICEKLTELPELREAKTIFSYLAMPDEVDLAALHEWAREQGKQVAFPVTGDHGHMEVYVPDSPDAMIRGKYNILTPDPEHSRLVSPEEIDAVLVPMVGFDRENHRMGQGGGYYDRYLVRCPRAKKIAVAFAEQELPRVITDANDVPMDRIVTDK